MKTITILLVLALTSSFLLMGCGAKDDAAAPTPPPANDKAINKTGTQVETPKA